MSPLGPTDLALRRVDSDYPDRAWGLILLGCGSALCFIGLVLPSYFLNPKSPLPPRTFHVALVIGCSGLVMGVTGLVLIILEHPQKTLISQAPPPPSLEPSSSSPTESKEAPPAPSPAPSEESVEEEQKISEEEARLFMQLDRLSLPDHAEFEAFCVHMLNPEVREKVALRLLAKSESIDLIVQITGMSEEEVYALSMKRDRARASKQHFQLVIPSENA